MNHGSFLELKLSFAGAICLRIAIDQTYLISKNALSAPMALRMSWASGRSTTYEEDRVYSLFGMFDVSIPALYGEGYDKAFERLQNEIVRKPHDESLYAWRDDRLKWSGLLAPSIDSFKDSKEVISYHREKGLRQRSIGLNSRGLEFQVPTWKVGGGNQTRFRGTLAWAVTRLVVNYTGLELDLYCSEPHNGVKRAVAIKLEKDGDSWSRVDCERLYHPRRVRYGWWVGRIGTLQWHGTTGIVILADIRWKDMDHGSSRAVDDVAVYSDCDVSSQDMCE